MARQRKNLKSKIASLSALGAGALIAGAGTADANTIYSGPLNIDVGTLGQGQYGLHLGGPNTVLSFARMSSQRTGTITHINYRLIRGFGQKPFSAQFASTQGNLRVFLPGAVFGGKAASNIVVGERTWGTLDGGIRSAVSGLSPFTNEYSLFRFNTATGQTDYGWIQLSYSVTKGFGSDPNLGPNLIISGYAFDDSGALLPAGDTGAATPEPSTMALTGLGALALGAVGLRRWRKSRTLA